MTTEKLTMSLEEILAAKRQRLEERRMRTPIAAVAALADMQPHPRSVLNTVTEGDATTFIGQVTHSETYDPVASALRYVREGVDAVALFTDQIVYNRGLDDMLLVARGANLPVISQDYILNEYHVVEYRAAGASALVLSASVLDQPTLRRVVTVTQRWRMTAIVQVNKEEELAYAQTLSPHVIGIGDHFAQNGTADLELFKRLRTQIHFNTRCMIMSSLQTLEEVSTAVSLGINAVIVSEKLLNTRNASTQLRALLKRPNADPHNS